jgi:hypothetical protein
MMAFIDQNKDDVVDGRRARGRAHLRGAAGGSEYLLRRAGSAAV